VGAAGAAVIARVAAASAATRSWRAVLMQGLYPMALVTKEVFVPGTSECHAVDTAELRMWISLRNANATATKSE
jgi:hypothetical protein